MPEIKHDGVTIHFDDVGDGQAVVLGHSFLCSGEMWAAQVPVLAVRHRVINIDLRGHGQSGDLVHPCDLYDLVGDVVAVLDSLDIQNAVWAGLSIGGMVAMRAALTVPERVKALVLADTHAGRETPFKKLKYRVMNVGAKTVGIRPFLPAVVPLMFGPSTRGEKPELVASWEERFAAVRLPSISVILKALNQRDSVVARLPEIRVPTLVIVGAEDASLPVAFSREISEAISGASLVVVPEAGHLSALEQPEVVTDAVLSFLGRLH